MSAASPTPLEQLERARTDTLRFVHELSEETLCAWPDADFSPIGWHLGHVAYTEAYWILGRCADDDTLWRPWSRAFAQGGRPKARRCELPSRAELFDYMERVRRRAREVMPTLDPSSRDPLVRDGYVGWLVASHEHQHRETMAFVRGLIRAQQDVPEVQLDAKTAPSEEEAPPAIELGGTWVDVGTDARLAYDNEQPAQRVWCDPYELDAHPVTCAAWKRFMDAGGYEEPSLWSAAGWEWLRCTAVRAPLGWRWHDAGGWLRPTLAGWRPVLGPEPVVGINWYEADAFARWRGARLPTETEWEHAARTVAGPGRALGLEREGPLSVDRRGDAATDMLGNVWEWVASWFEPYPGFEPFPYEGYSKPYFGATHKVLRGGSFATDPSIARATFRNWYPPHIRQVFAGVRCARDPR